MKWLSIDTAPKGHPSMDIGCPDASEWFLGRVSKKYVSGRPPYVVIRRKADPHQDSWECVGEAHYTPAFFDGWMRLPEADRAVSSSKSVPTVATRGMIDAAADYLSELSEKPCQLPTDFRWHEAIEAAIRAAPVAQSKA